MNKHVAKKFIQIAFHAAFPRQDAHNIPDNNITEFLEKAFNM